MKKRKSFYCMAQQHRRARKIYEEIQGMTLEQELAYWKRKSEEVVSRPGQPGTELRRGKNLTTKARRLKGF